MTKENKAILPSCGVSVSLGCAAVSVFVGAYSVFAVSTVYRHFPEIPTGPLTHPVVAGLVGGYIIYEECNKAIPNLLGCNPDADSNHVI